MRVLWIYAHPEARSLNASLFRAGTTALRGQGHSLLVSDLHSMRWQPVLTRADFGGDPALPAELSRASKRAYTAGSLVAEIREEQDKLRQADAVILQFPLWWYSVPAILKGWIDRVFVKGFAYGVEDPAHPGRTLRYGDGPLAGKRAQVIVTAGSPPEAMGPRGVNGQLDQVLFPLLHGTLWYVGLSVLPPLAVHGADHLSRSGYRRARGAVRERMEQLWSVQPLPYRYQNHGEYGEDLVLREEHRPGEGGLDVHLHRPAEGCTG